MSTETDHILAAIDSALEDYSVGEDAMRWNPEAGRVICDGGGVLWPGIYDHSVTAILDGTEQIVPVTLEDGQGNPVHGTITLTPVPFRFHPSEYGAVGDAAAPIMRDVERIANGWREWGITIIRAFDALGGSMKPLVSAFGRMTHDLHIAHDPRAHIRCRTCRPHANPGPLLGVKPSARRVRRRRHP